MIPTKAKCSDLLHHIPNLWLLLPAELKRCHLSNHLISFFSPWTTEPETTSEDTQHGDKRTPARLLATGGWAVGFSATGWAYPEDLLCINRWIEKPDRTRAVALRPRNRPDFVSSTHHWVYVYKRQNKSSNNKLCQLLWLVMTNARRGSGKCQLLVHPQPVSFISAKPHCMSAPLYARIKAYMLVMFVEASAGWQRESQIRSTIKAVLLLLFKMYFLFTEVGRGGARA